MTLTDAIRKLHNTGWIFIRKDSADTAARLDELTGHSNAVEACKGIADALEPCLFGCAGKPISWTANFDDKARKQLLVAVADADK